MALADVQDILPAFPGWVTLDLSYGDVTSGQASGDLLVKSLRDPLWHLHAESKILAPNELRYWKAKLAGLDNGRRIFLGYDFTAFYPAAYPNGSWPTGVSFDGFSATLSDIGGDGQSLTLEDLPVGFAGTIGDMLSITYGDDGLLSLVVAVESFTANGSGVTGQFAVRGALPAGIEAGDTVSVKRASCHMRIMPGSVAAPSGEARGVISFDAIQVPAP